VSYRLSPALFFITATLLSAQKSSSSDLDFLHGLNRYADIRDMLPSYIQSEAEGMVDARKRSLDVSTPEALARRRQYVREHILKAIGGLPERTPLNARVTGVVDREGYRIEKIIFESQPKFYVTANLYLPKEGKGPFPAILYPLGHETGAKAHETWQIMLVTLARKGYVALAWDPLGQGERIQLYDPDIRDSKFRGSTTEHTELGIQCLLTGQHIARYTIWDGIRALDYLLSRKEVDPARVAVTGNSGGGTHSAYLSSLDDRIAVAAPSCYITSWHWMLKTIGPQDAEQVFPNWLRDGLDYPDFLYAFYPKPYLMLSAIRDFFPIDGARETFQEAGRIYAEGKLRMVDADDGHGYSQPRRLAAYDWFAKWLKGSEDHAAEQTVQPETEETLQCTKTGQVATSLGGETVFSLNVARAEQLRKRRPRLADASQLAPFQNRIRRAAMERSGFQPASGEVKVTPYGSISRTGYRVEKLTYETDPGIVIPALLYVPEAGGARKPAVMIVDGRGKQAADQDAAQLAQRGSVVLSIDVRGLGETRRKLDPAGSDFDRYFGDYEDAMTGIMMGRTLVAMRARDIQRGLDLLAARPDVDAQKLSGVGRNSGAVSLLYAAAFDQRLRAAALEGMLLSYDAVVTDHVHRQIFEDIVPGALEDFDLPDLVSAIAPRAVWISGSVMPAGPAASSGEVQDAYSGALNNFRLAGAPDRIHLQPPKREGEDAATYYRGLLEP
jgi:cephalosporin-C deacetylase-like acetyl esterase